MGGSEGVRGNSLLSAQFFWEPKSPLKHKVCFFLKRCIEDMGCGSDYGSIAWVPSVPFKSSGKEVSGPSHPHCAPPAFTGLWALFCRN